MREFERREIYGWYYKVTPARVDRLYPGEILVVPTNEKGIHGAGLAFTAKQAFGLKHGVGEGYSGQCWALPTKRRPHEGRAINKIQASIDALLVEVSHNPTTMFLIPAIGTGLAKIPVPVMATMCFPLSCFKNVSLPNEFIDYYAENPEFFHD